MKKIQNFIVPILVVIIVLVIYKMYFADNKSLGSFSSFDTNNNANKDIRVQYVIEKGIEKDEVNSLSIFYAIDKDNNEVLIHAPIELPTGFENSDVINLKGHLHKEYFHAVEVSVD